MYGAQVRQGTKSQPTSHLLKLTHTLITFQVALEAMEETQSSTNTTMKFGKSMTQPTLEVFHSIKQLLTLMISSVELEKSEH